MRCNPSRKVGCHEFLSFPVKKTHDELQENMRVVLREKTLKCSTVLKRGITHILTHLTLFNDGDTPHISSMCLNILVSNRWPTDP